MIKKQAFTLAEVLITLGIIGVVAAMTIPTLVANYNTKQWNTAATVFNRKLEEALKTMNTQSTLAGHASTESFVEELSKHFKTNKICQNDKLLDCFPETVYWGGGEAEVKEVDISGITSSKSFGQNDWHTNTIGIQFANGVSALIAYNPNTTGDEGCLQDPHSNQITGENCLAILYDTSGNKNPNTSGKDLRANKNVTKLGAGCAFEINRTCYNTPFIPTPITKEECDTIKDDLGIKDCSTKNDYWAGAVKACGGVDKMPTMQQLAEIANFIYGTTHIEPTISQYHLTIDDAKAASLGLQYTIGSSFYIWSGLEESGEKAHRRFFNPTSSGAQTGNRSSNRIAICLVD